MGLREEGTNGQEARTASPTEKAAPEKFVRRTVPADLIEATPGGNGVGQWILASPFLLFLAWLWVDFIDLLSPLENRFVNVFVGALFFLVLIVLPLGLLTHRLILSLPRIFQHAGWDVRPLEPVRPEEMYTVRYRYQARHWADTTWSRRWLRVAQGWVYLEIIAIFVGAIVMIPLFFSAVEFGFGQ
ncbi:MAG: hypothetical protein R2932_55515 [Caldilineaceae bacterium]